MHLGFLKVSTLHTLYYEVCGNPSGQAVVYLHGGPGGGIGPDDRRCETCMHTGACHLK